MEHLDIPIPASTGLRLRRGIAVTVSGPEVLVEQQDREELILCHMLRTSAAPLPHIKPGDVVVYVHDETTQDAFAIGVIEDVPVCGGNSDELLLESSTSVKLRCGRSSVILAPDGRIQIRGVEITTRASAVNRVKGAVVKIN